MTHLQLWGTAKSESCLCVSCAATLWIFQWWSAWENDLRLAQPTVLSLCLAWISKNLTQYLQISELALLINFELWPSSEQCNPTGMLASSNAMTPVTADYTKLKEETEDQECTNSTPPPAASVSPKSADESHYTATSSPSSTINANANNPNGGNGSNNNGGNGPHSLACSSTTSSSGQMTMESPQSVSLRLPNQLKFWVSMFNIFTFSPRKRRNGPVSTSTHCSITLH